MIELYLFSAALVTLAVLVRSLFKLKAWDQWHHGWIVFFAFPLPLPVRFAALAIGLDDAWQHWYQNHTNNPAYQSPLHKLYALVLKLFSKK